MLKPKRLPVTITYKDGRKVQKLVTVPSRAELEKLWEKHPIKKHLDAQQLAKKNWDWKSLILGLQVAKQYGVSIPNWLKDAAVEALLLEPPKKRGQKGNPWVEADGLWTDIHTLAFFQFAKINNRPKNLADRLAEFLSKDIDTIRDRNTRANKYIEKGLGNIVFHEILWKAIQTNQFQSELATFCSFLAAKK